MIDQKTFINEIFRGHDETEHVLVAQQLLDGGFIHSNAFGRAHTSWMASATDHALYINVSTVSAPEPGDKWRRRKSDCKMAYVLVCDDIGTKVDPYSIPCDPSYKMETSQGNFQWGYILVPTSNLEKYEAVVRALAKKGFTDAGAEGCNRVVRLPGSKNLKPNKNGWLAKITEWNPDRFFELDEIMDEFGITDADLVFQKIVKETEPSAFIDASTVITDDFYEWLKKEGHVLADGGGDFAEIKCPWSANHTTGDDKAGYSPLGRGTGDFVEMRGFKCLHEHCKSKTYDDLQDWGAARGAPNSPRWDLLTVLQARYTYITSDKRVADMVQRPKDGIWIYDLDAWSNMYHRRVLAPGYQNPTLIKNAFLASPKTRKVARVAYIPGDEPETTMNGQPVVNTYIPPNHPVTSDWPAIWCDHIEYLLPDDKERECFLDWLAFKIQHPQSRSYATVLVADGKFGVGRSWVGAMLEKILPGHVGKASLAQLIGKGTSAQQNFNDWAANCQFLIVDEARDVTQDDFYRGYESFKQVVDTSPQQIRINPKYGKTRTEMVYFNALIFTNHSDAMVIPDDDRRLAVFTNPKQRRSPDYYARLHASLNDDREARRVFWWLMNRDVSHFNPALPPVTAAKTAMIMSSKSPSDEIFEELIDILEGDLVTRKTIKSNVKNIARELGYTGIESAPGSTVRRIWKQLGSLRESHPRGLRMQIDTVRDEIRAVRNKSHWQSVDEITQRDAIIAELHKNSGQVVSLVGNF